MTEHRRPLTRADAAAMAALHAAAERVEPTGEYPDAADLTRDVLTDPLVDLDRGTLAVLDGEELLAYATLSVRDAADPVHQMRLEALVHPAARGGALGADLLDWARRAAPALHRSRFPGTPLHLLAAAHENQRWYAELLSTKGYGPVRRFVDMRVELADRPPSPPLPAGFTVTAYEPRRAESVRLVRNDSFAEHWGSTVMSEEFWAHIVHGDAFRAESSFLVLDPEADAADSAAAVVAFVLGAHFASDTAVTGVRELYVSHVGTRRGWRGRGLAAALLGHTLDHAAGQGYQRSSLNVDTDNVTSALGLYERCGYRAFQHWVAYLADLGTGADPA